MTESEQPAGLDETVLDTGRRRLFPLRGRAELDETVLDPGRSRPDDWRPGTWLQGLPADLAARYELIRPLEVPASQGQLFLVRVRADGTEAVLKRRHTTRRMDPELANYLQAPDDHLVRHLEVGAGYEVMTLVEGRTLRERLPAALGGVAPDELHQIVHQLAEGLISLHRMGFLHRDLKPANIMVGPDEPVRLTLIDFGIAGPIGGTEWPDQPNLAYQPPESVFGQVGPASDWWGLGMTVVELASRSHPFEGLPEIAIQRHFGLARQIDVSAVPADRVRNLCLGLLAPDPSLRWGDEQVGQWLVGADPELPATVTVRTAPVGSGEIVAEQPYQFDGGSYYLRSALAVDLATKWDRSVGLLFDAGQIESLREWLDQFPDDNGAQARTVAAAVTDNTSEPGNVRLYRLLQALEPTRAPIYRNHTITRPGLMVIARDVSTNQSNEVAVLADLWDYRLLPIFGSTGRPHSEAGRQDLAAVAEDWQRTYAEWPGLVDRVPDIAAREELRNGISQWEVLAVCLRIALNQRADVTETQQYVHQQLADLPVRIPWFEQLVQDRSMIWPARLLTLHASNQARAEAEREVSARRERDQHLAEAAFSAWSRQQNRPVAFGWAVAGICLLAAFWFLIITANDLVQSASNTAITLAWVGASICLPMALIAECLLAAEIGAPFHPRYSIPGAGAIAIRPIARWMQRSRFQAFMTILSIAAGLGIVAVRLPLLLVAVTTAGQLGWVIRRLLAWRVQSRAEDEQFAAADRSRPSGTEDDPIEATEGLDP